MDQRRIPWPTGPAWRQSVTLDSRVYRMAAHWNEVGGYWSMDLLTREAEPIVRGVKIVAGCLLTARLADSRLPPGFFVVTVASGCDCAPGRNDMGVNAELIYVSAL
ncbi:MAG: hypothetical protein KJP02_08265 [Octadecabacter sp.]|nr:hypothetical protein [Octadecabacter sp.]